MVERTCLQCGEIFYINAHVAKVGKRRYCGSKCANLARTKPLAECVCQQCGLTFFKQRSQVARGFWKYCSINCRVLATRGIARQQQPHRYKHREISKYTYIYTKLDKTRLYGRNWRKQRDLAFKRDGGICQVCHHKPTVDEPQCHVHHIRKARLFHGDYIAANDLSNLITLCRKCHPKAENGLIAVPKRLL